MRVARTIGVKADGSEVILAASSEPIHEQVAQFNSYAVRGLPKDYVRVDFQTSDGRLRQLSAATLAAIKEAEARANEKLENRDQWLARQAQAKAEAAAKEKAEAQAKLDAVNSTKAALKRSLFGKPSSSKSDPK